MYDTNPFIERTWIRGGLTVLSGTEFVGHSRRCYSGFPGSRRMRPLQDWKQVQIGRTSPLLVRILEQLVEGNSSSISGTSPARANVNDKRTTKSRRRTKRTKTLKCLPQHRIERQCFDETASSKVVQVALDRGRPRPTVQYTLFRKRDGRVGSH